ALCRIAPAHLGRIAARGLRRMSVSAPTRSQSAEGVVERSRATAAAGRRREAILEWGGRITSLLIVLAIWEIYGRRADQAVLAPPTAVIGAGIDMIASGELWSYLRGSLQVLVIGFAIALVTGIPLGVAMARSKIVRYALDWYIDAFNSTPNVA